MKKTASALKWAVPAVEAALVITTLITDRRIHNQHDGEHLPCDCRGTCLSCLRG